MKTSICRLLLGLALVLGLIAIGSARAADLFVGPGETYTTIQSAVDAAATTGDVVHVASGVYVEQVLVDGKSLAIVGAGAGVTIIRCPATIQIFYTTSYDHYPVLGVQNGEVDLSALTVDGDGQGNNHFKFLGIDYHNAGGEITDVAITGVRDTPFSGLQHGVSLYLYNEDATARAFTVDGVDIDDFQKNAMAIFAAAGTALIVTVRDCETVGAGPTSVTAQNGIQISGPNVDIVVEDSIIRDVAWDGPTWTATGLLLFDCHGTVQRNDLTGCQTGITLGATTQMNVTENTIVVPRVAEFGQGVTIDNIDPGYSKRSSHEIRIAQAVDPGLRAPAGGKATLTSSLLDNILTLDPAVNDYMSTYGIFAYNYLGYDDLSVTVSNNEFTGFEIAAIAMDYAPSDGNFLAVDYGGNDFLACPGGVSSNLSTTVAALANWWGAVDGPGGDGSGSGSTVTGNVDYDPWVTDYINLFCVPDPLNLTEAVPAGSVIFDYTGGASGRIYGYSIDVEWDPAVATAAMSDFTLPSTGAFAGVEFFFVQQLAPGHVRVDAAIGGLVPGTYADPLFQALFTAAAGALEGAQTAVTMTVIDLRDYQNQLLTGIVPDPGLIHVDTAAPTIPNVVITDTTLPSVDWTRNGHDLQVDATVIEGDIATLTCDLTAFGGPILQLADATVAGNVYTWTWGPVSGTGNGPVSVLVTCTDHLAQSIAASDDIVADNTVPTALSGFLVTPGHEQIHLAWAEPTADGGSPIQGVVFRYIAWGGYPHYTGALPIAPADVTLGDAAGTGPQTGAAWDWPVLPRDVYALSGFVVDFVGNASPLGDTGLATNYWLGDTDGDGYITVVPDIHALGDTYGLTFGDPGYNGVCDVGPTTNYSPRGVPNPQIDGFQVQFDDLVLFAMNYGEVDPATKFNPGTTPDIRWERLDAVTWVLTLVDPCSGLKAVNVQAVLPDGVGCQVVAGSLLAGQDAPVFLQNIAAHGLDAGLAVIGFGVGIEGDGELMRVVVNEPVASLDVKIDARDLNNQRLLVDQPEATGVDLPRVHRLDQNAPNPFNPATVIAFELPSKERVQLSIYTVDGRLVRTLVDDDRDAGRHKVTWKGRDQAGRRVATGTYFYALRAGDFRLVRKMTLVK